MTSPLIPIPGLDDAAETSVAVMLLKGSDWQSIMASIKDDLPAWNESTLFVYSERVAECVLDHLTLDRVQPPDDGFECRLFDGSSEVRCVADNGSIRAWHVLEGEGEPVLALRRRYHLVGLSTDAAGKFTEGRYPDVVFSYPVGAASKDQRAWIEVVEYYRREPQWDSLSTDSIRSALAEPLLVAHRFCDVGVGD